MLSIRVYFAVLVLFSSPLSAQPSSSPEPADVILHHGTVYTVDANRSVAEAIAINGAKISAVGTNDEILKLRGEQTKLIDLGGKFVMPGFNDTHVHFGSAAKFLEFNIMAVRDQETFVARVKSLTETLPEGEWITGGLWGAYDQWAKGSSGNEKVKSFAPDMRLVESFSKKHPIFIRKFDNSEFAANRAALQLAGLDPDSNKKQGEIEFLTDPQGQYNGRLKGRGVLNKFRTVLPRDVSLERRIDQTKNAMRIANQYGVTSLSDMSDDVQLKIYRQLQKDKQLTLRVHFRYSLDRWPELANRNVRVGSGSKWIRFGGLKGHIDGIMGTSSARFFEPYDTDRTNRGRWRRLMVDANGKFVEGKFLQYMLDADKAGLQITVHAIGDEANHLLLDYLEELNKQNGKRDRRFRLVHAQVVADDDIERMGKLGVIAEVQPYHLSDDMRWMELRIGKKRCEGAYAFKKIRQAGAMMCFGSDWPGTSAAEYPINPMLALYAATTRQTITGLPEKGWYPDQRIDIHEAIAAYTSHAAYSSFEEKIKGSIEAGKLADLVMLSDDLTKIDSKELLKVKVLSTWVDGKQVYQRGKKVGSNPSR